MKQKNAALPTPRDARHMVALALATALALRYGHGTAWLPLELVLAGWLAVFVVRFPAWGLAVLPPLLLGMGFIPNFAALSTQIFIAITGLWVLAMGYRYGRAGVQYLRWILILLVLAGGLLAVNYWTAMQHGIALGLWLRGLFPFLLLGLALPVMLVPPALLPTLWKAVMWSVGFTSLLLAVEVDVVFLTHRFWEPIPYYSSLVQHYLVSDVGQAVQALGGAYPIQPLLLRIASIIPEAQGILLPVGMVGWFVAGLTLPVRWQRIVAAVATAICLCAVSATLTRSMLLCGGLGIGIMMLLAWRYGWVSPRRGVRMGLVVLVLFLPFALYAQTLESLWARSIGLVNNFSFYVHMPTVAASKKEGAVSSPQVTSSATTTKPVASVPLAVATSSAPASPSAPKASAVKTSAPDVIESAPVHEVRPDYSSLRSSIQHWPLEQTPMIDAPVMPLRQLANQKSEAAMDIGYRAQEYHQAWNAFRAAPLTGQGFGYQLTLHVALGDGKSTTTTPSYIHNWVAYWLMVAGVPGVLCFALLLLAPLYRLCRREVALPHSVQLAFGGTALILVSYALFFAVFRSLPYTLLMAVLVGWMLTSLRAKTKA